MKLFIFVASVLLLILQVQSELLERDKSLYQQENTISIFQINYECYFIVKDKCFGVIIGSEEENELIDMSSLYPSFKEILGNSKINTTKDFKQSYKKLINSIALPHQCLKQQSFSKISEEDVIALSPSLKFTFNSMNCKNPGGQPVSPNAERKLTTITPESDDYPVLEGLAYTIIGLTCVAGLIYYIGYIVKGFDATPFWILLHFIQLIYLMIMLEVDQPASLVFFLDKLEPCKLDLNFIDEFTTIRDEVRKEVNFMPDRQDFRKIAWDYGSVLVNLAFYARIICTIIILHAVLKITQCFANAKNEHNGFFKGVNVLKKHISKDFYIRYCIEITLFLWTAVFIEFMSTPRDSSLVKLSLVIAINILCFLVYFTFSFAFALYAKNTNETYRGYFYTFFLMKRGIIPICLITLAYASKEWQLGILWAVQLLFLCIEILSVFKNKPKYSKEKYHIMQCLITSLLSIGCNILFLIYLCLNFIFISKNINDSDNIGESIAITTSCFIIAPTILITLLGIFRLFITPSPTQEPSSDHSEISADSHSRPQISTSNPPKNSELPSTHNHTPKPSHPDPSHSNSHPSNSSEEDT
ncbi:unnamed protein product [Moneuplotes crassus]|uniref:Uncharacterized protein n=1 Tax=Euplotes crassus TaxID=5936 RepID=A0AAD1U8Q5_EUPCR|nr:unnamed protein product [Moneuplotes crassus]